MRPGRAADHSPPSSAAVMEEQSYTSTHPLGHTGPVTGTLYLFYKHLSHDIYKYIICISVHIAVKGMRYQGSGADYITRSFMLCTSHQILFG